MTITPRAVGLIQRCQEELQVRHSARRTLNTYEQWLPRFLRLHRIAIRARWGRQRSMPS
jgi:hypothetical protein